jgi:hypothetical protein
MAKRKSRGSDVTAAAPSSGGNRMHLSIDSAENGMIVRVDGEKDGHYHEKKFVATSPRQDFRIASAHLPGVTKKAGAKKKGKSKRFATKKG